MTGKLLLLTKHYLEFRSLKGGSTDLSESTCQNATLLEITCRGSNMLYDRLTLYPMIAPFDAVEILCF